MNLLWAILIACVIAAGVFGLTIICCETNPHRTIKKGKLFCKHAWSKLSTVCTGHYVDGHFEEYESICECNKCGKQKRELWF